MITLFHWDLPLELETRYGGLLNKEEFVADFANYARIVFKAFSGKVKYWVTFNEPWCSSVLGYNVGQFAPGRTSDRSKSPVGDGSTECWIVGHSLLVAHGAAVKIYREEFKPKHGGEIGITLNGEFLLYPRLPVTTCINIDIQATGPNPGTPVIPPTSKQATAKSNSPSPGSQTRSTSANTQTAWSSSWATDSRNGHQRTSPSCTEAMISTA